MKKKRFITRIRGKHYVKEPPRNHSFKDKLCLCGLASYRALEHEHVLHQGFQPFARVVDDLLQRQSAAAAEALVGHEDPA